MGMVGKVQRNYLPKEVGMEGKEKDVWGPGLEPGTYCMLGKSPQLHASGGFLTSKLFRGYR